MTSDANLKKAAMFVNNKQDKNMYIDTNEHIA